MVECSFTTKRLWVRILTLSLKLQIWWLFRGYGVCFVSTRSSLTFRQTIKCRFTLKLVCDIIITYRKVHRTDKYSQHGSLINKKKTMTSWAKWLWVRIPFLSFNISKNLILNNGLDQILILANHSNFFLKGSDITRNLILFFLQITLWIALV